MSNIFLTYARHLLILYFEIQCLQCLNPILGHMRFSSLSTDNLHNKRLSRKKIPINFNEVSGEVLLSRSGYINLKDFLNSGKLN